MKRRKNHKPRDPWFSSGLKVSSRKCLKLYKEVYKSPHDSVEFQRYREYRKLYNKLRRQAKYSYYNKLISENCSNSKKLWKVLNKITGKLNDKQGISEEFIINGVQETDRFRISNAFGRYYSTIGKKLSEKIDRNVNGDRNILSNGPTRINECCFFHPTTEREIEKLILKLKAKDSKGYDGITNKMLKAIYTSILPALNIIFNKSLCNGEFPHDMKLAIVKPLYKAKNKSEISNYRPISLLPVISKVLEKLVHIRIMKFLERHKILYEGQYGFRKLRNTSDAILDLTGNILDGFNKGMYTLGLFLDMTKAFDCINHQSLFCKLDSYGIRGIPLNWIKSYLSNRSLKVEVNNVLSDRFSVTYGTPQGSVLGPLLYIIFANDMPKILKFTNSIMFADDTTIFISGKNLKFLYRKINDDMKRLTQWFKENSLTVNVDKSFSVLFKTKKKLANYQGNIIMGGAKVKQVDSVKFLGVHLDQHLDWNIHCQHLLTRLAVGTYSLFMTKNMLPYFSKRLIYLTNVECHLLYGISAWGSMLTQSNLKKLIAKQNNAIRAVSNIRRRDRIQPHYKSGKFLKLQDLIEISLVKVSYRYTNNILPQRIVNIFEFRNHNHNTRYNNNPRTPHHSLDIYSKSFLARAPHFWQNIPQNVKDKRNIQSFSNAIKQLKLDTY